MKEFLPVLALVIKAFEDGKITGAELKQILGALISDDWEFSVDEVMPFIKGLLSKF